MSTTSFDRFVSELERDPEFKARLDAERARLRGEDDGGLSGVAARPEDGPRPGDSAASEVADQERSA